MSTPQPQIPRETAKLPTGAGMPMLGFGTWQINGDLARQATGWALEAGYRHVDTATMYENEGEVGAALLESEVSRDDVFVTTKLPPNRAGKPLETLHRSLELLGVDHVDLWLIHWPPQDGIGLDLWAAFIQAREQGLATDIGVSNYSLRQIDQLTAATGEQPAVNQIRWSPKLFNPVELAGHRERGIVLEGYSALRGGTLTHPVIVSIAERLGRTPAQVIIRWHIQHEIVVIPKSANRDRIRSNADVGGFELSAEDMTAIDAISYLGR